MKNSFQNFVNELDAAHRVIVRSTAQWLRTEVKFLKLSKYFDSYLVLI